MNSKLIEQKDFKQQIKQLAKSCYHYRLIKKTNNFHALKNYPNFGQIAECLALELMSADHVSWALIDKDFARKTMLTLCWEARTSIYGVYAIKSELYEAFQNSDIPKNIGQLQRVIPKGILLLPPGINSPDGTPIRWIIFQQRLAGEKALTMNFFGNEVIKSLPFNHDHICWATHLADGACYASSFELDTENAIPNYGEINIHESIVASGKNTEKESETIFLHTVSGVLFQALLYMQVKSDDLIPGPISESVTKGQGFGQSEALRKPLWVGAKYTPVKERFCQHGTHASPKTHWRRGYYRQQAFGKGYQQHYWRWIEPVLVNG